MKNESAGEFFKHVNEGNRCRFDQTCRVKAVELASPLSMRSYLSINFMPNAVYRPELRIRTTLDAAEKYGFPINRIIFEITEGEKVDDVAHLREKIVPQESYDRRGYVSIAPEKHSTAGRLIFQLTERSMKTTEEPARRLFRLRKLPARYAGLVMPFLLSIFMTCVVSLISTLHSVGLTNGLFNIWMGAWGLSWVIAFPTLLVVLPMVKAATGLVVEKT